MDRHSDTRALRFFSLEDQVRPAQVLFDPRVVFREDPTSTEEPEVPSERERRC
jgi:hypothetical protein